MAKKRNTLTHTSPDVVEFIDAIVGLPLAARIELIAEWERMHKQSLPVEPFTAQKPGESSEDYGARSNRYRDLLLARMLAVDFFKRRAAAARKKTFNDREAAEAARRGITVYELQREKKAAKSSAALDAKKVRELDRLARRAA